MNVTNDQPNAERDEASSSDPKRPQADKPENNQGELNERLDDALEETFPSSDPVSVKVTK